MLLGYGGMVSLGHAGLSRHRRLYLHPAAHRRATTISPPAILARGRSRPRCAGAVRRAVAARARPRLHHDHAGARPDRLGHRLSRQRPHRRRQRHPPSRRGRCRSASTSRRADASTTSRWSCSRSRCSSSGASSRSPFGASLKGTRDQPRRMTHARLQCLADPLADLRDRRLLGLGRRPAVRLLQPVPQPARARRCSNPPRCC